MGYEPTEMDFVFDAAGWFRNPLTRRYECEYDGEVIAAVTFEEVRLITVVEGWELDTIFEQAAEIIQAREAKKLEGR